MYCHGCGRGRRDGADLSDQPRGADAVLCGRCRDADRRPR
jgi:hypothetical protein